MHQSRVLGTVSGSNCKSNNYLHTQERTQSTEPQELHAKRQFREAIDVHCAGNLRFVQKFASFQDHIVLLEPDRASLHSKIEFNFNISRARTRILASISSYLHIYIIILAYSIPFLINLFFLSYFNPLQMLLSFIYDRITSNRCKITPKIFRMQVQ